MKKIKNPELHIRKLKNRIVDLEAWLKDADKSTHDLRGEGLWHWNEGYSRTFTLEHFPTVEAGDQVILVGRVASRKTWIEKVCRNKHTELTLEFSRCRKTSGH